MSEPIYPDITVKLSETDGNAFCIIGMARYALRKAGESVETIKEFTTEASAGDYDHAIQTVMHWMNVE